MQNAITTLRIQNFKSIKDVTMQPRRVNIIIGEPNVGKSNILEAMSLLGGMVYDKGGRFMDGMIRYQDGSELFFDNISSLPIKVETESFIAYLSRNSKEKDFIFQFMSVLLRDEVMDFEDFYFISGEMDSPEYLEEALQRLSDKMNSNALVVHKSAPYLRLKFDNFGELNDGRESLENLVRVFGKKMFFIRPYSFARDIRVSRGGRLYLEPPHGENLKEILQSNSFLRDTIAPLFRYYGQKLLLRMSSNELEIAKEVGDLMYTYPYSNIADTLQRLIFYFAAIESNDDAVLLFEEPEAHSYPVYISRLARRIVESQNNQFFVVTHSPYFITEVLEEMLTKDELKPELAIFVAYYEDYQTKVRQLGDEEVYNIRRDGLDVFYNMARFVPQKGE